MRRLLIAALVLAACGGDDAPPPAQPGAAAGAKPGAPGAKKKKDPKDQLQARAHAEDQVQCPVKDGEGTAPDKSKFWYGTGPDCKQDSPTCDPGLWCVAAKDKSGKDGFKCEPCTEKDSIRHEFKDRDFIAEQARDPFQSFVIVRPDLGKPSDTSKEPLGPCTRSDQLRASTYSYQDLKLVGLVSLGTRKTALMMNSRNIGEFVRRGDCVGKEKALVADIVMHDQTACLTFQVAGDLTDKGARQPPREQTICLYPNGLPAPESQPTLPSDTNAPQVAPPPGTPQVAPPPSR
jgi:hypothetical protein